MISGCCFLVVHILTTKIIEFSQVVSVWSKLLNDITHYQVKRHDPVCMFLLSKFFLLRRLPECSSIVFIDFCIIFRLNLETNFVWAWSPWAEENHVGYSCGFGRSDKGFASSALNLSGLGHIVKPICLDPSFVQENDVSSSKMLIPSPCLQVGTLEKCLYISSIIYIFILIQ